MSQYHFNQALLELNMMKWVWETFLGFLQAPTLRAASKCSEQLSTARAQSCEHRAGWRPLRMGPAVSGTGTGGLQRLGKRTALWEKYREFPHTWGQADNSSQGLIKYLQALDFVLNFCVKCNSHAKERRAGWEGRRQGEGRRCASFCVQLRQHISTSQTPQCSRPRSSLRRNCLLSRIMPNSGVFFQCGQRSTGD